MKGFLIYYCSVVLIMGAWFAFKSIRRMVGIARGTVTVMDLSLQDAQASHGLFMHPTFGEPFVVAVHPFKQFLKRWIVYFPLAWATNAISPTTWILALPGAVAVWLVTR